MYKFLIFAPPTPPRNLIAGILSAHVRCTSPRCLLRVALLRAAAGVIIILEMQEERMKEFSGTFVFLHRMLGGL